MDNYFTLRLARSPNVAPAADDGVFAVHTYIYKYRLNRDIIYVLPEFNLCLVKQTSYKFSHTLVPIFGIHRFLLFLIKIEAKYYGSIMGFGKKTKSS